MITSLVGLTPARQPSSMIAAHDPAAARRRPSRAGPLTLRRRQRSALCAVRARGAHRTAPQVVAQCAEACGRDADRDEPACERVAADAQLKPIRGFEAMSSVSPPRASILPSPTCSDRASSVRASGAASTRTYWGSCSVPTQSLRPRDRPNTVRSRVPRARPTSERVVLAIGEMLQQPPGEADTDSGLGGILRPDPLLRLLGGGTPFFGPLTARVE